MSALVSVVIPSRAGAQRLPRLLALLQQQTYPDWEAVVVLDGDVDDSARVVEAWADRIPLRSVVFPENRGRAAALNAGHQAARGEILVRCDDDLAPGPDYLARHAGTHAAAAATEAGHVGVIGMCRNVYPPTAYARAYGEPAYARLRDAAHKAPPPDRWRFWGGNVSVDRWTWERVGPYDEDYRGYGWEDVDWGYRLWCIGIPLEVVPGLETDHLVAATTTATRAARAFDSGLARQRFESKHGAAAMGQDATRGAWNRLVDLWSRACTSRTVPTFGTWADRVLPVLPAGLAEKAVALQVEAAAKAGRRPR